MARLLHATGLPVRSSDTISPSSFRKRWRWALVGGAVLAAAAASHERFVVRGASMLPTLQPGDRLLVRRWPARARPGDLVVVAQPGRPARLVVKRLAAWRGRQLTVLGDNPAASTDSRQYGALPRTALRGRVVYRYAPAERSGRP